jgi:hypothetical protein
MIDNTQRNRSYSRRWATAAALTAFFCATAAAFAQPSNTNHGSATGIANASDTGLANSNVNGIGTGTAPVPELSTWAAMGTLALAAAYARFRRRKVA